EDFANIGVYKFVNGKLIASFESDSYVAVKTGDNLSWYMTNGYPGDDATSAKLYNTATEGIEVNKMRIPGRTKVELTLVVNTDETLQLSYKILECSHDYTSQITAQPTCTADGTRTYHCGICGHSYTETIAKLGHKYTAKVTAPTCTDKGYTTHTCDLCSDSYKDSYVDATGHNFVNGTCTNCGTGCDHSYDGGKVTTSATCTADGVKTYTCTKCGGTRTENIAATGHSYGSKVTAPTCTAEGYTTYTCSKCGDKYTADKVAATGHSHTGKVTKPATCTADGVKTFTCHCGDSYTEAIPATGHSYVGDTCTGCGDVRSYYLFGWINGGNYACEEDGENIGIYKFVGGKLTATFESDSFVAVKTGDNQNWYMTEGFDASLTSVKLYDTAKGITAPDKMFVPGGAEITFTLVVNTDDTLQLSYVISNCPHAYEESVTREPGCTDSGLKTYTCAICGDVREEEIPAKGHSFVGQSCTACGTKRDFYLFGYINGANYACEEDSENIGIYKFVSGKLSVSFESDSYVAVKTGDNQSWFMTNGYP
ncbi:MAG: hypothetical protein II290_04690, partial [Oscillospiraceae bacterium]|nr:hypothetical protein [Oscillospiraceae bacterium]